MTQVNPSTGSIYKTVVCETSGKSSAQNKAENAIKYIPERSATSPQQKTLEERTAKIVVPQSALSSAGKASLEELAQTEVKALLLQELPCSTFGKNYAQLTQLQKLYSEENPEIAAALKTAHPQLSNSEITSLRQAIVHQIELYTKDTIKKHLAETKRKAPAPPGNAEKKALSKVKSGIAEAVKSKDTSRLEKGKQHLQQAITPKTSPSDSPSLSPVEQMLVKEVAEAIINQHEDAQTSTATPKERLENSRQLAVLYQEDEAGLDDDASSDIDAVLTDKTRKHNVNIEQMQNLSLAIAKKVAQYFEASAVRLEWQTTGEIPPERDGSALENLAMCKTVEDLQQKSALWADQHYPLSPPEERVLKEQFQRIMSHTFFHSFMLKEIHEKTPAQRTAALATLLTQMEEAPEMTQQNLRSNCKSYPKLLEMMGYPVHASGAVMQQELSPLVTGIYEDTRAQAHNTLTKNIRELFSRKPATKGKEVEQVAQKLNLTSQATAHRKELVRQVKTSLQNQKALGKYTKERENKQLEEVEKKVRSRASRLKAIVSTAAIEALGLQKNK